MFALESFHLDYSEEVYFISSNKAPLRIIKVPIIERHLKRVYFSIQFEFIPLSEIYMRIGYRFFIIFIRIKKLAFSIKKMFLRSNQRVFLLSISFMLLQFRTEHNLIFLSQVHEIIALFRKSLKSWRIRNLDVFLNTFEWNL